ncbi:MAG: DNA cytosine methyltransferase [Chlorobi bacterium]|nr:MAG: DNA-cytosine methyltransferase [Chlorobi bacterium OLB7]MBK8910750.1 DNA cytosine methyltransferase [Chlorobiota bacterium]
MNYIEYINAALQPSHPIGLRAVDLFAGCGGISLGFEAMGIAVDGYEMDPKAASTYNHNLQGHCFTERLTLATPISNGYDIVLGGPPCQPFSVGGHQKGAEDDRNGFPVFINAIRNIQPKLWLFENVRGMLYSNRGYFEHIVAELGELGYRIEYRILNAVNYGVPQNRERLFVVGHRSNFNYPPPLTKTTTVGEAIGDLIDTTIDESKILTPSMDRYVLNYEKASKCVNPRDLHLNKPARTLTCRNIAAPTGDMQRVRLSDGRRRRISIREAARLQSFPDWFTFHGTETQQYYQIGNAVPPILALHLAKSVVQCLTSNEYSNNVLLESPLLSIGAQTMIVFEQ